MKPIKKSIHLALKFLLISITFELAAVDIVGTLLKDTVATFSDSYDLIYYSVKSALVRDLREQKNSVENTSTVTNERIESYLESRGISPKRDRQPIQRKDFARLVMKRFDLPLSFFTRMIGSSNWYYRDAVRAGLFSDTDRGDETMSTRELLSVLSRAESLSRAR